MIWSVEIPPKNTPVTLDLFFTNGSFLVKIMGKPKGITEDEQKWLDNFLNSEVMQIMSGTDFISSHLKNKMENNLSKIDKT